MRRHHAGEGVGLAQRQRVHVRDAGREGRMVHEDERRPLRRGRELARQPVAALRADPAGHLARHQGVQADQTQRPRIVDVVAERGVARPGLLGKGRAQRVARIVIAGDQPIRHREAIELARAAAHIPRPIRHRPDRR
jgi:hypothetical protein